MTSYGVRDITQEEYDQRLATVTERLANRARISQPDLAPEHVEQGNPAPFDQTAPIASLVQPVFYCLSTNTLRVISPSGQSSETAGREPSPVNRSTAPPRVLGGGSRRRHEAVNPTQNPAHVPTPAAPPQRYTHTSAPSVAGPSQPRTASSNVHGRSNALNTVPAQSSGRSSTHQSKFRHAAELVTSQPNTQGRTNGREQPTGHDPPRRPGASPQGGPSTTSAPTHPSTQGNGRTPADQPAQTSHVQPDSGNRGHHSRVSGTSLPTRPEHSSPETCNTGQQSVNPGNSQQARQQCPPTRVDEAQQYYGGAISSGARVDADPPSVRQEDYYDSDGFLLEQDQSHSETRLPHASVKTFEASEEEQVGAEHQRSRDEEFVTGDETERGTRISHGPTHGPEHQRVETSQERTSYLYPVVEEHQEREVQPSYQPGDQLEHQAIEKNQEEKPESYTIIDEGPKPTVAGRRGWNFDTRNAASYPSPRSARVGRYPSRRSQKTPQEDMEGTPLEVDDANIESEPHHTNEVNDGANDINDRANDEIVDRASDQVNDQVTASSNVPLIADDQTSAAATAEQDQPMTLSYQAIIPSTALQVQSQPPGRRDSCNQALPDSVKDLRRSPKPPKCKGTLSDKYSNNNKDHHSNVQIPQRNQVAASNASSYYPASTSEPYVEPLGIHDNSHDLNRTQSTVQYLPTTNLVPSRLPIKSPAPSLPSEKRSSTDKAAATKSQNHWKGQLSVSDQQTAYKERGGDYEAFFKSTYPEKYREKQGLGWDQGLEVEARKRSKGKGREVRGREGE